MMKIICAWCKTVMNPEVTKTKGESHGICEECNAKMMKKINEAKQARSK